jgi:hypothetical protein
VSKEVKPVNMKTAILDPAAVFNEPEEIVEHPELSTDQKLQLLRQWERDALNLSVAEGEGMAGGEESRLRRVRHAIDALDPSEVNVPDTSDSPRKDVD